MGDSDGLTIGIEEYPVASCRNLSEKNINFYHHILNDFFLDIQYILFYGVSKGRIVSLDLKDTQATFKETIVRGKGLVGLSTFLHNFYRGRFS
jgi:hypothetical protein